MKPILVGINNPYSSDTASALVPWPERSAGHRLWRMYHDTCPYIGSQAEALTRAQYTAAFDRRNLFPTKAKPHRTEWRTYARKMLDTFPPGSTAILLGADVREAFSPALSTRLMPTLIHPQVIDGMIFRCLPHPSGRVTLYNDPIMRMMAGMVLAESLQHSKET